jgi:hypothetical protein
LKTSRLDTQPAPGKRRRGRRAERHGHRRGKRVAAAGRAPGPRGRRGDNAGPGGRGQALGKFATTKGSRSPSRPLRSQKDPRRYTIASLCILT